MAGQPTPPVSRTPPEDQGLGKPLASLIRSYKAGYETLILCFDFFFELIQSGLFIS